MSEPDKKLEKALGENGAYDPEKAEELRKKVVGTFEAKMRKVERWFWGYMCLCAWLFVFTLFHFFHSSTTKALLFYGLLMLIFFETTILMKLWYFVMNNKISVLKAIKQLELGGPAADDADTPGEDKEVRGPLKGLPRWERGIWWVAIICGGALIGAVKGVEVEGVEDPYDLGRGGSLTSQGCVTLAADGSGSEVTEQSFVHQGTLVTRGFNFYAAEGADLHFVDSHGNELPVETQSEHGHVRHDVRLPRPLMPGRRFSYTRTQKSPKLATQQGGVWTYSTDFSYGYDTNEFSQTVVLPEGAEIVSASPWPVAKFTLGNKPTVRFQATRGCNEPFKYTIQYRLPAEPSGKQDGREAGRDRVVPPHAVELLPATPPIAGG